MADTVLTSGQRVAKLYVGLVKTAGLGTETRPPTATVSAVREKLIKIGAKVVRHGRYITFQMVEVAIPRTLFVEILHLIDGLRPTPLPP